MPGETEITVDKNALEYCTFFCRRNNGRLTKS